MESSELAYFRTRLGKTQQQMAQLLGVSIKAVHSYEQGWRKIPGHVERQVYFLVSRKIAGFEKTIKPCWVEKKCSGDLKKKCPAYELKAGKLCWFINGTVCDGEVKKNWQEKMALCRTCDIFKALLDAFEKDSA